MRKSYHIRFNINGQQVEMKLRAWARENRQHFPNFGFRNAQDDHPTTHSIRDYCIRELNAHVDENDRRVIITI